MQSIHIEILNRLSVSRECDRQTDKQTHRWTDRFYLGPIYVPLKGEKNYFTRIKCSAGISQLSLSIAYAKQETHQEMR